MKRLTKRMGGLDYLMCGNVIIKKCENCNNRMLSCYEEDCQTEIEVLTRLAEYEDSNLTPAEVAELAQAKADGRVAVLPVSVGDTVYRACGLNVIDWTIERIVIFTDEIIFIDDSDNDFKTGDIGKTVFLTHDLAEKALKECEK